MFSKLVDALFGCSHSNYSFPRTASTRRSAAATATGMYVVCLDCGRELAYDWQQMRVVPPTVADAAPVRALATRKAA
jgi:hypothetical protein